MVESRLSKELVQVCVISSCSFKLAKTPKKSPVFIVSPLHRSMTRLVIIMTTRARLNTLFITGHRENSPESPSRRPSKNNHKTPRKAVLKQHQTLLELFATIYYTMYSSM